MINDNKVSFEYGRILGKIEAVLAYMKSEQYIEKKTLEDMLYIKNLYEENYEYGDVDF